MSERARWEPAPTRGIRFSSRNGSRSEGETRPMARRPEPVRPWRQRRELVPPVQASVPVAPERHRRSDVRDGALARAALHHSRRMLASRPASCAPWFRLRRMPGLPRCADTARWGSQMSHWPPSRISSTTSCPSNRSVSGCCRSPTRYGFCSRPAPRCSPKSLPSSTGRSPPSSSAAPDCAWASAPAPEPSPSSNASARR